jgi:ElaB/YqjD/DUF883 family membrane-anchored ribosome-binding protein
MVQQSALEFRVQQLIDDVHEALRLGAPGAVDAVDQLEAGAKRLVRERQARVDDANRHREADDEG